MGADILGDLDAVTEGEIENGYRRFLVRAKGTTVAVLRRVGARLPLTISCIGDEEADGKGNAALG